MKKPRKIVVYLFNFLLLSVPLYFRYVNEELFEFNKMILVYAFTTLIVSFWLAHMIQEKKFIFKKTALDIPILLFFISQLVSTIFSIHQRTSFLGYYSRFNGGLLSIISYILLYYAFVSNVKKKDLFGVLVSMFTSAIIVSVYGILEHFGHSISCLFAPGLKDFSVSCWKQDVQSRVFATFGQPNWLAAYAITILPLGISLSIQNIYLKIDKQKKFLKQRFGIKIFFSVASILLFTVLIFTRSRSGLAGLAVGMVFFLIGITFSYLKNKDKFKEKINTKFFIGILCTIFIIAGTFGTMYTPSFNEIAKNSQNSQGADIQNVDDSSSQQLVNRLEIGGTDSGEIRKIVWKGGINIWKRYPIIGSGVETFAYSYYLDRPREHNDVSEWDFLYNKAHNELINILSTTGLFGLSTYLLIYATFGTIILKTIFSKESHSIVPIAILAGIISLFVSNFFGFSTVMVNVLTFVLFGIFKVLNEKEKEENISVSKNINSPDQYFSITILGVVTLMILFKIYNYWSADSLFALGKANFAAGNFLIGVEKQLEAIKKSPNEANFYDNLSNDYAKLAIELARTDQATASAQLINEAIRSSDLAIKNNNRNLNFYKTRSRVFITLAQIDSNYLNEAQRTLEQAIALSPTDPKLLYTQAIIELSNNNIETGYLMVEKTLELKPNYEKARWKASELYEANGEIEKAITQLQYIIDFISPNDENAKNKILELRSL